MCFKKVFTIIALVLMVTSSVQAMVIPGRWEKVAAEKPGSEIVLTLMTGERIECSFVRLSTDSLVVSTSDGVEREYSKATVELITSMEKQQDSLVNGAAIGALIGGLPSALLVAAAVAKSDHFSGGNIILSIPIAAGLGAGIGLAVDASIKDYEILYKAPKHLPES